VTTARRSRRWSQLVLNGLVVVVVMLFMLPIVALLAVAFQESAQLFTRGGFVFQPTLDNFARAFATRAFDRYVANSFIVAGGTTVATLVLGTLAAYGLARYRFKARDHMAFWILSIRMMPPIAAAIPIFIVFRQLGMLNTHAGLILVHLLITLPLAVWMLRGFFEEVPIDVEESARIDGCSAFGVFWRITLPLSVHGIAAAALLSFVFSWNEFLFALLLTGPETRTLPVAITGFIRETGILWGQMGAAGTIMLVPTAVITLFMQRYLVRGLTMGAVK
jgi:multiple sugar transport system permease protein